MSLIRIFIVLIGLVIAGPVLAQDEGSCVNDPVGVYQPRGLLPLFSKIRITATPDGGYELTATARYNGTRRFPVEGALELNTELSKIEAENARGAMPGATKWPWKVEGFLFFRENPEVGCNFPVELWIRPEVGSFGCRLQVEAYMPYEFMPEDDRQCSAIYNGSYRDVQKYYSDDEYWSPH